MLPAAGANAVPHPDATAATFCSLLLTTASAPEEAHPKGYESNK